MAKNISAYVSEHTYLNDDVKMKVERFHDNLFVCKEHQQIQKASSNYASFSYELHKVSINNLLIATSLSDNKYRFSIGVFGDVTGLYIKTDDEIMLLIISISFNPPWDIFLDEKRSRRYYASTSRITVAPQIFVSKKDIGFGFEESQTPDGYFYINRKGRRKMLTPEYKKLYSPFQERNGEWFAIIQHKDGRLEAFSQKGNLVKMTKDWQDIYSLRPNEFYGKCCESLYCVTDSELCRIVESVVGEYLNKQRRNRLNEKFYNPATEPMIDGHIGNYDVLDGAEWEQILCDLPKKGWVEDIRMYSAMDKGGKTYCLYRRKDNGKYFFVEVFDDNKDEYLHIKQVNKNEVPISIWNDAVSLIRCS